jgi:uncharacterized protein (TIGR03435 family)
MMNDDMALLREFAASRSECAFETLVARHIHLVYSAALRQVGDPHLAEEITQAVFIILARKAGSLGEKTILSGWLYRTAQYASADALKMQRRREHREQEAYMQSLQENSETASAWLEISPLLDEAMTRLGQTDRDAVVLRYFENKSLREVGGALGLQERAAQKRIARALEKLRAFFANRGVAFSAAAIARAVSANSVQAAPVALTKSVTAVAIVKGSIATASTLILVKGALNLMSWAKVKTATLIGTGILVACGLSYYSWQVPQASFDVLRDTAPQIKIVPAKYADGRGSGVGVNDKNLGISMPLKEIIMVAYGLHDDLRMIVTAKIPSGYYDYIANLPSGSEKALQQEIKEQFGIVGHFESQPKDLLILKVMDADILKSKLTPRKLGDKAGYWPEGKMFCWGGQPASQLAETLEQTLEIPVFDETGVTNLQDFNFVLPWDVMSRDKDKLKQALKKDGFELILTNQAVEMLVVEKVK